MTIFSKLTSAFKSLPFSAYGGSGYGGGAAYIPGVSLTGSGFPGAGLPGTNYDYKSAAGVLWQNPSAAACFVALTKAFAQSRPVLERRDGKQWQQVDEHALLDLLNVPNEFYSGERLFGVTLISTMANGAGYWRIERDRKGDPAELWFEPPSGVGPTGIAPAWDEEHFIREYFYFIDGKRHGDPLPRQDVVYFRHGLNPANSREPWAPLSLAAREIATLNSASTYTGALLRNSAVPSGMVTLEGSSLASGTPPTPEQAEEMKRRIKAGFKGDQVGEPFVSSLPWKWTPFNWSPEQLNISKLQTWPQGMVCALLGTPEIVALLPTGEQPTYQNLAASMEWWWNNTVIPLEDAFADEIETQLFPAFGLDRHEYRLTWDRSQVPALQEDEIAKHQMVREDYRAGVIDLFTATVQLGGEAMEDMHGVYHPSAAPKGDNHDISQATKRIFWFNNELKYDPNEPRDEDGKWTEGAFGSLHNWQGPRVPSESKELQEGKARAFERLLPYAQSGAKEAVSIILTRDGSESTFRTGNFDEVHFSIPGSQCVALHTHPGDFSFSAQDWYQILGYDNVVQDHVIGPTRTFSLHKPKGWKAFDITTDEFNSERDQIIEDILSRAEEGNKILSNGDLAHEYSQTMAKKYGILYRVGIHKKRGK